MCGENVGKRRLQIGFNTLGQAFRAAGTLLAFIMGAVGSSTEFRILGPFEVVEQGHALALGGPRQRAVLAMLLLQRGQVVPTDRLIDQLWDERPPHSPEKTIQVYVSRLRKILGDGMLETAGPGYRLAINADQVDAERFDHLSDEGRAARAGGEPVRASEILRTALDLWRGPPLSDLADQGFVQPYIDRLTDLRLATIEDRIDAELALGGGGLVPELEMLVGANPLRERLRGQLMLALYRSGRQAEALDAYRNGRSLLIEELGLEPCREVRDLQARILRHDPGLDPPAHTVSSETGHAHQAFAPARADPRAERSRAPEVAPVAAILAVVVAAVIVVGVFTGQGQTAAIGRALRSPGLGVFNDRSGDPLSATALADVPTRLTRAFGAVWATSYDAGTLVRIDAQESTVTQTVPIGTGATGVAAAAGDLWVADSLADQLERVDAGTYQVVETIHVGSDPTEVAAGAGSVWVANTADGTVSRIDPLTGTVVKVIPVGASPDGLAVGDGSVWVALGGASGVARLDPRSDAVAQTIRVGSGPSSVAVGDAGVWVANTLDSTVSLINPRSDTVVLTRAVPGAPDALAATGSSAWIAGGTSQVTLLSSAGNTNTITTPSAVDALATDAGKLLVGVLGTGADHRGGTLQARISDPPFEPLDPAACCDIPANVLGLSYDGLLAFSKSPSDPGRLIPDLALAIPDARDRGLTYTFRLRPGLRYWNGAPVRASDFVRGFERAAENSDYAAYLGALPHASACPNRRSCNLSQAIQTNDRAETVTLRLTRPDPNLLTALGQPAFAPDPGGSGIRPGTGPYRPVRQVVGHLLIFERNLYFHEWSPAAQPNGYPDKIVLRVDGSASADVDP